MIKTILFFNIGSSNWNHTEKIGVLALWSKTKLSLQVIPYRDWLNDLIYQSGNDQTEKPHILIIWGTFDSLPCLPSRGGIPLQHSGPPEGQGQRTSVSSLERTVKHHTPSCYSQRVSGHWNKTRYGRCVHCTWFN